MIFTKYKTAAEFSCDTLALLKEHEIQNNLLLKNIGDGPNKTMLTVKDDSGRVLLIANRTGSLPMVMYEAGNIRNDEAVDFFAGELVRNYITADFFMTEPELAKSFVDSYGKATGKEFKNTEKLVLYVIDNVNDLALTKGSLRPACEKDLFFLPYWNADFAPACGIGDYDLDAGIAEAQKMIKRGGLYIWEDEYPVSMAEAVREVTGCRFIGKVYTPPNLRCSGYSTACVFSLTKLCLESGYKYCALYADCANPYSNAVYRRIGYKESFWYSQYKAVEGD